MGLASEAEEITVHDRREVVAAWQSHALLKATESRRLPSARQRGGEAFA